MNQPSGSKDEGELPMLHRRNLLWNEAAARLYDIVISKKSNICYAADYTNTRELLEGIRAVGAHVCMVKIHVDILEDFSLDAMQQVDQLAKELHFLVFEDRKIGDIGRIAMQQLTGGIYRIADWADFVTIHPVIGEPSISAMAHLGIRTNAFLVANLTGKGNLIDADYTEKSIEIGANLSRFVAGFIGSKRYNRHFLTLSPGISMAAQTDGLGQTYRGFQKALSDGSDILIVGSDIRNAKNPKEQAEKYQKEAFEFYQEILHSE